MIDFIRHIVGSPARAVAIAPAPLDLCARQTPSLADPDECLYADMWPTSIALWMSAFYLALFIIRPWEQLMPWMAEISFERLYALAMIAVLLFTRGIRFRLDGQTLAVLALMAALTVSAALAWNPADAWEQYYVYLTLVVFFVVLVSVIRTPYEIGFMVTCYIVAMSAYLAKSQWEFFVHGQHRYDQGVVRMIGIEPTFGGPNSLAMSIVVSLPMLLFLFEIRKQLTARWTKFWQMAFRGVLAGYALLASTSIVLTNSRSGMVSFIVFVALVVLRGKGRRRKLTAAGTAAALLLLIWVLMPVDTQGRFESIWNPEASSRFAAASAQGRIAGARAGLNMFLQHTLSGVGIGNFVEYRVNQLDRVPLQAHNLLGQVLGETGLLGGAAFLLLVGVTLRNCFRIRKATDGLDDPTATVLGRFAVAVQISVILLLFEGLFSHNAYRFNWLWLAAFAVLAVHFALQNRALQRDVS